MLGLKFDFKNHSVYDTFHDALHKAVPLTDIQA